MREMVKKSNLALAQVPQNGIDHDGIINKASQAKGAESPAQ